MSRSFAEVVAAAQAATDPRGEEVRPQAPPHQPSDLSSLGQVDGRPAQVPPPGPPPALDADYAAALDGPIPDHVIEDYLRRQEERQFYEEQARRKAEAERLEAERRAREQAAAYPMVPPNQLAQPASDAGAMMAMLMQQNQALQQQIMQLTQRLSDMSYQIAQGGGQGTLNGAGERRIRRAGEMGELEQWRAMHGDAGLLG